MSQGENASAPIEEVAVIVDFLTELLAETDD